MRRRTYGVLGAAAVVGALAIANLLVSSGTSAQTHIGKFAQGDPDSAATAAGTSAGEGPIGGYDAYIAAEQAYPANVIPPSIAAQADTTFNKIAKQDQGGDPKGNGQKWSLFG